MAEILCPMCGQTNPDEQETCQHCQARLKPLIADSPTESSLSANDLEDLYVDDDTNHPSDEPLDEPAESDNWLTRIRNNIEGDPLMDDSSQPEESEDDNDADDDWLARIRTLKTNDNSDPETPETDSLFQLDNDSSIEENEGSIPDWLSELGNSTSLPPTSEVESQLTDWLESAGEPPTQQTDSVEETPAALSLLAEPGQEPGLTFDAEPDSIPDWLTREETPSQSETATAEDTPDWMDLVDDEVPAPKAEYQPEEQPAASTSEQSIPDLFDETRDADLPADKEIADAEILNLLSDIDPKKVVQTESPPQSETATTQDTPDWMDLVDDEVPAPKAEYQPEEQAAASTSEQSIPDLFDETQDADLPADKEIADAEILNLLSDIDPKEVVQSASPPPTKEDDPREETPPQSETATTDDIPDWMDLVNDKAPAPNAESQPDEQAAAPTSDQISPDPFHETRDADPPADKEITDAASPPPTEEDYPDWLRKLEGRPATDHDSRPSSMPMGALTTDESIDDSFFDAGELPTWLGNGSKKEGATDEVETSADDLSPSVLPQWLEAMRPVEVVAKKSSDAKDHGLTETSGPLAGISGVLKAEPEMARLQKIPKYSGELEVSGEQLKNAAVFLKLLEQESTVQTVAPTPTVSTQRVSRVIIAVLFFIVVSFVIISSGQPNAPSFQGMVPAEVLSASEKISMLSPEDTVLIAFDYEPGTSGEINTAAAPVLDHIMLKGAKMALISTSPTGPALAEEMLNSTLNEHRYMSGNQYVNLGYIPGGASGLLGFTQIPQRITPLSFDGMAAWDTRPLEGIHKMTDFSLVLVITDNPDIARTWFEQIQPTLAETPIIAIVSAQAEPIVKPYYGDDSAQIQGLVSGILGGAAYEQTTGRANLASKYWNALNLGIMTSIIVILLGSTVNVATTMIKRNHNKHTTRKAS